MSKDSIMESLTDEQLYALLPTGVSKYIAKLREEVSVVSSDNERLENTISALEELRPHWAQGYTDDSMAAQASTNAKADMWKLLNASSQTEAMSKLRTLIERSEQWTKTTV